MAYLELKCENTNLYIDKKSLIFINKEKNDNEKELLNILSINKINTFKRKNISFLLNNPVLIDNLKVYENIELGKLNYKDYISLDEIIKLFSLSKKIISYPKDLSKAEKIKVLLARALIKKPKILVCDNILDDLDKKATKKILNALLNYTKKYNAIVIISSSNNKLFPVLVASYSIKI